MAEEGASTPVASAIATGNATSTASAPVSWSPAGTSAADPCATGATKPFAITKSATPTNARVMVAKIKRPPCPNQVRPATTTSRARARGTRTAASPGRKAMIADAPAATLIVIVSV